MRTPGGAAAGGTAGRPTGAAPPELAETFRPLWSTLVTATLVVVLAASAVTFWVVLPAGTRHAFNPAEDAVLAGVLVIALAVLAGVARTQVRASERGLVVVNGYRTRRLDWAEVVAVWLRRGEPWVRLDVADGTSLAVLAIQSADGVRARRAAQRLADLVEARGAADHDG